MRSRFDLRASQGANHETSATDRRLSFYEYEQLARVERARIIGEMLAEGLVWCIRPPRRIYTGMRNKIAARRRAALAARLAAE